MYVVLDVESTGGPIEKDAIIEIALFRFDGEKITDQLISLVHTERPIQAFVQKMTGITPNMLRSAPRWHEIAKRVVEITEDAILVGHGVSFDYRMVRQEFERLGYPYERSTIDTVNWSRKLFPGEDSYKLTSLCESLGIWLPRNHRAGDDARATVDLFKKLLDKDIENRIRSLGVKGDAHEKPSERLQVLLKDVKDEAGIYYIYDSKKELLQYGLAEKMHNELSRVFLSPEAQDVHVQHHAAKLEWEPTGTRLIAQLKLHTREPKDIEKIVKGSALVWDQEKQMIVFQKNVEYHPDYLAFFRNASDARKTLRFWQKKFGLCKIEKKAKQKLNCECFDTNLKCHSLCLENREKVSNQQEELVKALKFSSSKLQLRLPGRNNGEKALIHSHDSKCAYVFFKLEKEIEDQSIREKNSTEVLLDSFSRGLLWRQLLRYPKGSQLDLPDSLALKKPE